MFERLAGKILSRLLSKYFVSDDTNGVRASSSERKSWSQLGVWSGYVSLESLELRKEVINDYFKSKGLPFELLQCTLGRVEITVPWAKLGLSSSDGDDAVVVVVVDGVHALVRTNYEFDDDALREAAVKQRRRELQESESFAKEPPEKSSYSSGFSGFLEKRLADGIFKDILEKLHIHVRDLHIRLEDVQSDPANPSAFGVTFESLHVQADEDVVDETTVSLQEPQDQSVPTAETLGSSGVIRKVAQLNHFAIYWNALDYGEGLPTELSILHDTMHASATLAKALDRCIARRVSSVSSPMRAQTVQLFPNHTFLLLPMDASWHARLSTDPRNLELRPALVTNLRIDDVSVQLRDFQCHKISILITQMKEHSFAKNYRQYRPSVPATVNPRAWWLYAFRIIRMELREGNMRWSWSRFEQRLALRRRYCDLYERQRREQSSRSNARGSVRASILTMPAIPSSDSISELTSSVPDEGAGPPVGPTNGVEEPSALSQHELNELKELEGGTRGDLSVNDIVLFRALVNARVAADQNIHPKSRVSRLRRMMSSMINDDIESKEEYERLLAYVEQVEAKRESLLSSVGASFVAVSIDVHLERGCISFFSPLRSTEDLNQHRRIQQRFLDFSTTRLRLGYFLLGNYESYQIRASLDDFVASEIRTNRKEYIITSRLDRDNNQEILEARPNHETPPISNRVSDLAISRSGPDFHQEIREVESGCRTPRTNNRDSADQRHLAKVDLQVKPLDSSGCNFCVRAALGASEITLLPDGEWFHKIKKFASSMPSKKISLSSFWEEIGMAQINLLSSRRAGLLAKAETAIFKAKNVDLDFHLQCPIIHVTDGRDSTLTIDLGHAHFATKRLAGVATSKLLASTRTRFSGTPNSRVEQIGNSDPARADKSVAESTDSSSVKWTPNLSSSYPDANSSPRRTLESFFLGGSATSVLGNRAFTRSINGDTPYAVVDPDVDGHSSQVHQGLHSSFYDEFQLDLRSIYMSCSETSGKRQSSLMGKLDVQLSIAKSVIPSDHTLCRFRTQCMIQDVTFYLSESSIICLVGLAQSWIEAMSSEETSTSIFTSSLTSAGASKIVIQSSLPASHEHEYHSLHETLSDSSSLLDENEFLDALESQDNNDNAGAWFDDNWIADAESVAESDIRSISRKKGRRRRTRSVSDVSSISDKSWGRRKQANNVYLSAENLARLEELRSEDDDGSDLASDAESFHSALSLGGYEALAEAMEEDIRRTEGEITELKKQLAAEARRADGAPFRIPEARRRLQVRRNLRIEIDRTNAELCALRATHEDLVTQLDSARAIHDDERLDGVLIDAGDPSEATALQEAEEYGVAVRAKALLRARRLRSSSIASGDAFKHKLTTGLNRELLSASFVVSKASLVFDGPSDNWQNQVRTSANFNFCMNHCALAVLRRANEWRVYAGVDSFVASIREEIETEDLLSNHHLMSGGTRPPFLDNAFLTPRPLQGYNATIAAPDDKVLRLTLDRRVKQTSGPSLPSSTRSTRLKIHVGDIEIAPREQSIASLMNLVRKIDGALDIPETGNFFRASEKPSTPFVQQICRALNGGRASVRPNEEGRIQEVNAEYADISCRLSSVRVNLSDGDITIGSLVLTDVGARFLQGLTSTVYTHRSQLDIRCNNVQLIELNDRHVGLEMLSCRDPYGPIAQLRVRTQLVSSTHEGGWVVGETASSVGTNSETDELAWNMHVGAKLNSVYMTISSEGIKDIQRSFRRLKELFTARPESSKAIQINRLHATPNPDVTPVTLTILEDSSVERIKDRDLIPIRWRGDFAMSKFSVLFPTYGINEIDASHTVRSNVLLTFSQHSSFQATPSKVGTLLIRSGLTGVSLVRTSDEWPLLESMVISSDMTLLRPSIVNSRSQLRLTVPDTFFGSGNRTPLNHGSNVGLESHNLEVGDCDTLLSISMSPARFNFSVQTCCLLLGALSGLEKVKQKDANAAVLDGNHTALQLGTSSRHEVTKRRFVKVLVETLEMKLLRESGRSTIISFADPLTSLVAHEVATSVFQDSTGDEATIEIREVSLYDLSSLPGARVFGINSSEMWSLQGDALKEGEYVAHEMPHLVRLNFRRFRENIPSTTLKLQLGRIQCLLLPSTLQSLLAFRHEMSTYFMKETISHGIEKSSQQKEKRLHLGVPFGARQLEFAFHVNGFECILPSRDLASLIRRHSDESVSVVTFRWTSELIGEVSCPPLPDAGENLAVKASKLSFENLDDSAFNSQSQSVRCITALARLRVGGFQVLRTNVKRRHCTDGTHISPCSFMIHPPVAGEQRITNPFWFNVSYQVAVVSGRTAGHAEAEDQIGSGTGSRKHLISPFSLSISHAVHVDTGFIDILVYIRQSAGGMNDALKVTVKPILDMLKKTDESDSKRNESQEHTAGSKFVHALKNATVICSLQSKGLQVTCVPGGATRLTESPIAKCELSQLRLGMVAVALPINTKVAFPGPTNQVSAIERLRQAGLECFGVAEPVNAGGPRSHMTLGGWIRSELSASYHNRRLVAWEPFVEPWVLHVRAGIDLVRAFTMVPSPLIDESRLDSDSHSILSSFIGEGNNERAGERIRDIGRLLRSPFSPDSTARKKQNAADCVVGLSASNMSYVIMKSIAPEFVISALCPIAFANKHSSLGEQIQRQSSNCLPGTEPAILLEQFGYPSIAVHGEKRDSAAFLCSICDSRPLNVNVTGALIENVLGFLGEEKDELSQPIAPHLIRNSSGLTVRFQEYLDAEQLARGEVAKKIILSTDREIPLSLKRSMSQSCDPHRAYILLELGSFEDTAGRINHHDFNIGSRSRSTMFFYKAKGKIPVDTVGVHKYALCHRVKRRKKNGTDIESASQGLGSVIVRIALQGATKLVSIESPFILKNSSEVDLLCELRNHGGVSLLWRSLVPRALTPLTSHSGGLDKESYVSLPVDLVATAESTEATLSVAPLPIDSSVKRESDVPQLSEDCFSAVDVPPSFSKKSVARGLIRIFETNLGPSTPRTSKNHFLGSSHPPSVNLNTCAVRIGSMPYQESPESSMELTSAGMSTVPEQRMLFFRPPLVIRNHLPVAIIVQARVKYITTSLRRMSSTAVRRAEFSGNDVFFKNMDHAPVGSTEWHDLGTLACGKSLSWTGATAADKVEMRVRLSDERSEHSRKFQDWSTCFVIPSEASIQRSKGRGNTNTLSLGQLSVFDEANARLRLSVSLEFGSNTADSDSAPNEDVRWYARTLPSAPRVVGISVPFWIIDSTTGQDLEFLSNTVIAGQTLRCSNEEHSSRKSFLWTGNDSGREQLGLAELLEDEKLSFLSAMPSFEVLMIGDVNSTRLCMRRRIRVFDDYSGIVSKWCDPIALRVPDNSSSNVLVPPPTMLLDNREYVGGVAEALEPLAIRTRIIAAPEEFGGTHGTKLIHVVSRYRIVNEMGREIEVIAEYGEGIPMVVGVDGRPIPFHFNGTSPIRFRPTEFGWGWSGRFSVRKKRREVTLRLVHKLKGQVIIAEVEFIQRKNSGGNVLIFRGVSHPPFRLENQTMQALHFGQSSVFFGSERGHPSSRVSLDSTILPYHHAEFAWDEPDEGRRSLVVEIADLGNTGEHGLYVQRNIIGRFDLDRMAPGTQLRLSNSMYSGQIVADGPTRVLRITDSSLPPLPSTESTGLSTNDVFKKPETVSGIPSWIEVRLTHGIGISVVDWSPQELLYIQLDEITMERRIDSKQESVAFGISCCSVDNQLWVTPFPVLLRIGRRTHTTSFHSERIRRRRSNAISVAWQRTLNAQGDLTLVDNFKLSTEPVVLCIDGYLSELLWKMARQASGIHGGVKGTSTDSHSRDAELRKVLWVGEDRHDLIGDALPNHKPGYRDDSGRDAYDGFLTAAVAAKLRMKPRTGSIGSVLPSQPVTEKQNRRSKKRRKYYVGKWKISTTQTEISWSGPLPSAFFKLPDIMRPALTFEALPVLLRPYSNSHAYGTVEDLIHDLKSHYLSIWRVLDVLVGLAFRPTFLIRACIYTSRERCADAFDSISSALAGLEKGLIRLAEPEATCSLLSNEISPVERPVYAMFSTPIYQSIIRGSLLTTASFFHSSARLTSSVSSVLRYGGSRESSRNPASGSVRARNPRLFAHVDGKDLLVEYVEGENAGKAILSRVRMGHHLGEGYVFHCERVYLQTAEEQSQADLDSPSLICMVTSERVFLLNGDRQANFFSVVWESIFLNLVELEINEFEGASFHLVKLWYLVDTTHSKENGDTRLTLYAKAMVSDTDWGLDILLCKSIFVPSEYSNILRSRIAAVHRYLDDTSSS